MKDQDEVFDDELEELKGAIFNHCTIEKVIIVVNKRKHRPKYSLQGGNIMYIVKDDTPDVAYQIGGFQVIDAEGSIVPDVPVVIAIVSDNPDAVAVTPDPTDQTKGIAHFGSPNPDGSPSLANINVSVALTDGTVVGSFGSQFTVTAGDPKAISGGKVDFSGLTES